MKNTHQQILIHWLKKQGFLSRRLLNISRLLGLIGGLLIISQSWILAQILHSTIIESIQRDALFLLFSVLAIVFILRALVIWLRERISFHAGQHIRYEIRRQVLNRLEEAGPSWIQRRPVGNWATLILEQIDDIHDYYARYLPQVSLATCMPLLIISVIFPTNWVAALILLLTAPLIPVFMILVGVGAEEANRRNFLALARLSGYFLDRLRGMETIRVFGFDKQESENIRIASQDFRKRTMKVLRIAFLSSGVLEFFSSLSIALIAVYFGFSYFGALDFGHYGTVITLSSGFLTLILSPEFFQPLRDLGVFYHAKSQAIGAADNLKTFLETPLENQKRGNIILTSNESLTLIAENFSVLSPEGVILAGPLNFILPAGKRVVLIGSSGSGKSSLLNAISGFMPYTGSLRINGIELRTLEPNAWRTKLSWVGQNPHLPAITLRDNVLLGRPNARKDELQLELDRALVSEFLPFLPNGIETVIGDQGIGLSVGQAQRVAIARALLRPCCLLLLDEPTANLDVHSEKHVMQTLDIASRQQTTLLVTHELENVVDWDIIWVMNNGRIVEYGDFSTISTAQRKSVILLANYQKDT